MGILDDAIREHLDLKRAHGASDDEIARKEAEAFGPARQEAVADETTVMAPAEFAEPAAVEPVAEEPAAVEPGFDDAFADEPPVEAGYDPELTAADTAFSAPPAEPAFRPVEPTTDAPGFDPAAPPDAPFEPQSEPEPAPADPLDQPTEDFDPFAAEPAPADDPPPAPVLPVHDEHDEEHAPPPPVFPQAERPAPVEEPPVEEPPVEEPPPGGEEDVLEETPEFLQDTPEHDRLWFEQKPPRDFDFGN